MRLFSLSVLLLGIATNATAGDLVVAPVGGDFDSIQDALDAAQPGDRVLVRDKAGGWGEQVAFPRSGNASAGLIELKAFPGDSPALDGTGLPGEWMIAVIDRSYIRIAGLTIRNNVASGDGSGIRIEGSGQNIEIADCVFHALSGDDSMAITVYGTGAAPIEGLVIRGNEIYDCTPAESEALTLNGNVRDFLVEGNTVRDVDNIGIDFIGGEASIHATLGAREGICRGNFVLRANASYGGGFGAGIYVDGGRDIIIEHNLVVGCDLGIEIGAENAGWDVYGIVVRDNVLAGNEKAGLVFGGYESTVGRVRNCRFVHNLLWHNDTIPEGIAELWIQWAADCEVRGNVIVAGAEAGTAGNKVLDANPAFPGGVLEGNLWYGESGAPIFEWAGTEHTSLGAFRTASGQSTSGLFAPPGLVDPLGADGQLGTADDSYGPAAGSPCIDAGDALTRGLAPLIDYAGGDRFVDDPGTPDRLVSTLAPQPDLGPIEFVPATGRISRHCEPLPSTPTPARIGWSGSTVVGANTFTLRAQDVPASQFGLFAFAPSRTMVPAGDGLFCLGGASQRLSITQASAAGQASYALDFSVPPASASLAVGSTWSFQFWFRNPAGALGFSFTDALEVEFL